MPTSTGSTCSNSPHIATRLSRENPSKATGNSPEDGAQHPPTVQRETRNQVEEGQHQVDGTQPEKQGRGRPQIRHRRLGILEDGIGEVRASQGGSEPGECKGASFDAFTLSNILDGTDGAYQQRLVAAVKRAAAPGAMTVLRSFGNADANSPANPAADDRSMLWGSVLVRPAAEL